MKIKLAIIYGILMWVITYALSEILNPIFTDSIPHVNIIVPIIIIIVTVFFGILYIRNIESNEVIEGIMAGIIFIIIDVILDLVFFIIPHNQSPLIQDFTFHSTSMIVITLLITTFLGYLAQMSIDLK